MPPSNEGAPVLQKRMPEGHDLKVYGPHHADQVDEYQARPDSDEQGPLLEQGVVPAGGTDQHEWVHTHNGEPVNGGNADSANEAMAAAEKSHADLTGGWDPSEILGRAYPRRKQAWSGWGPSLTEDHHHKVAGFDWDDHLNGYVSSVANPRTFECSCGAKHPVPSYSNCKCGKTWNSYVIGTGGDRHEASADRFIAREIPQRENVIVANRQLVAKQGFDPRQYLVAQRRTALNPADLRGPFDGYDLDDEVEDASPFPSDHHPKAGDATMRQPATDWHSRRQDGKWAPGGHQPKFKKGDS
jgi:hypothetical protein